MGGYVHIVILERAVSPEYRWDRQSVEHEMTLQHGSLDPYFGELLSDEKNVWRAIERLLSPSVINEEEENAVTIQRCQ